MNNFICFKCGEAFPLDLEEEAIKEYEQNFTGFSLEERGDPICTKCYEEFWDWAKTNAPELKRQE